MFDVLIKKKTDKKGGKSKDRVNPAFPACQGGGRDLKMVLSLRFRKMLSVDHVKVLADEQHFPEFRHRPQFVINDAFEGVDVFPQFVHFGFCADAKGFGLLCLIVDA